MILLSTSRRVCPHTQRGAVGAVSVLANSRHVAELFGKRHDSVLRSIYDLDCSDDFRSHNFVETCEIKEIDTSRRQARSFDMTKDGFTFLVMGFTGSTAARCGAGSMTIGRVSVAPHLDQLIKLFTKAL